MAPKTWNNWRNCSPCNTEYCSRSDSRRNPTVPFSSSHPTTDADRRPEDSERTPRDGFDTGTDG